MRNALRFASQAERQKRQFVALQDEASCQHGWRCRRWQFVEIADTRETAQAATEQDWRAWLKQPGLTERG
jgi:hypothetical protein